MPNPIEYFQTSRCEIWNFFKAWKTHAGYSSRASGSQKPEEEHRERSILGTQLTLLPDDITSDLKLPKRNPPSPKLMVSPIRPELEDGIGRPWFLTSVTWPQGCSPEACLSPNLMGSSRRLLWWWPRCCPFNAASSNESSSRYPLVALCNVWAPLSPTKTSTANTT